MEKPNMHIREQTQNLLTEAKVRQDRMTSGNGTFGDALMTLRIGHRVQRSGWNGKGIWLALTPGSVFDRQACEPADEGDPAADTYSQGGRIKPLRGALAALANTEGPPTLVVAPHIDMRAADGSLVIGWLASQTDMLAMDWRVLP